MRIWPGTESGSRTRIVGIALLAAVVAGCGTDAQGAEGPVVLEFFQFKPEAVESFDRIIEEFNAEHPGIRVQQNHVPDADTALRVRLVREDVPDVMTLNAGTTFGELATAGVFHDFSDDPVLDGVTPAIVDILTDLGTPEPGQVNGVPFANNASAVIYNVDLFDEHGVEVPRTWDELLAAVDALEAAGVLPFYQTLGDAWTSLPAWNGLAGNLPPEDFWEQLRADETSFAQGHELVADRLYELFERGQGDRFSTTYDAGNQAFARGESAMYLQGIWALPAIRSFEPDSELGTFAMPADDADETVLVSGVDVALTMPIEPEHPDETMTFIEYLMRPEVVEEYAAEQSAIPVLEGTEPSDPALEGVAPYFDEGRLVGFPDHQVPATIPLDSILQQFLIDGDKANLLGTLDDEWDKVARRRS
jgi:raffinose/stachyose/melibiose transport system substrate-binding protein